LDKLEEKLKKWLLIGLKRTINKINQSLDLLLVLQLLLKEEWVMLEQLFKVNYCLFRG
jgi:hypothetical protein